MVPNNGRNTSIAPGRSQRTKARAGMAPKVERTGTRKCSEGRKTIHVTLKTQSEPELLRKYWESLFHVLKLYNLPPLFYNLTFYCASFWAITGCNGSFCPRKHFAETGLFI